MATGTDVIRRARSRHALFDPVAIPTGTALDLLNGVVGHLRFRVQDADPLHFVEQASAALPLPSFDEGILLPPFSHVEEAFAVELTAQNNYQRGEPVAIIPASQRFLSTVWPALFVVRDRVFLKGTPQEWANYSSLVVTYVPSFAPLTHPDDELPLPPMAELPVIEALAAAFALRRSTDVGPAITSALAGRAVLLEEQLLTSITAQRSVERWTMREY